MGGTVVMKESEGVGGVGGGSPKGLETTPFKRDLIDQNVFHYKHERGPPKSRLSLLNGGDRA